MRIGVVSAHYMPEVGYQEVHLPRAFSRIGHSVKVFTSDATVRLGGKMNSLSYQAGTTKDPRYGYEIQRLPAFSVKSKAIPFSLRKAVSEYNPDVLVILGVAKIFPLSLLSRKGKQRTRLVSIYGDAQEYLDRKTVGQKIKASLHELGYATIKKALYKRAVKYCDRIILNIPESDKVIEGFLNEKEKKVYNSKKVLLNLGYDPDEYFFNQKDREEVRKNLHCAADDIVIITSTRINRRKNLEEIIILVSRLRKEGKKIRYVMVGFLGDAYEAELKSFIGSQPDPSIFSCFPFLPAGEIRKLYCAADIGIWLKVAISIQEAMGTGLPVILENKPSVSHLVRDGKNGWFFAKGNLPATLEKAVDKLGQDRTGRQTRVKENEVMLSYDNIARKILDTLTA